VSKRHEESQSFFVLATCRDAAPKQTVPQQVSVPDARCNAEHAETRLESFSAISRSQRFRDRGAHGTLYLQALRASDFIGLVLRAGARRRCGGGRHPATNARCVAEAKGVATITSQGDKARPEALAAHRHLKTSQIRSGLQPRPDSFGRRGSVDRGIDAALAAPRPFCRLTRFANNGADDPACSVRHRLDDY